MSHQTINADCPRCGFGTDANDTAVCPLCREQKQSLLRYGSNSLDKPIQNERSGVRVLVGMAALVAVMMAGFFLIVRAANSRLDRAVERIERASR